jgi:lipopolysaccharide/colanic/teichoic acid biosynthesis glycosyltransferase
MANVVQAPSSAVIVDNSGAIPQKGCPQAVLDQPAGWTVGKRLRFLRKKYTRLVLRCGEEALQRGVDVVLAAVLLVLLFPLVAVIVALIKLTDGGPVLFWQTRVGRWGRLFAFPKFRSMIPHTDRLKESLLVWNDHKDSVTFKMRKDPRLTWIGRIIRKLSIDELPQLWCVLRGEMTLVGPRPPLPEEVTHYTLEQRRRLEVTPGLTCIWQVSGRSNIPFLRQVEMDVDYIDSRSLSLNLKILLKTVPAVLLCRGAF